MPRKAWVAVVIVGCVATAPEAREAVGDAMTAVGDAMADAGRAMGDAGVRAQEPTWQQVECVEYAHRVESAGTVSTSTTWAALVDVGDVDSLTAVDSWSCDPERFGPIDSYAATCATAGTVCSGETPPSLASCVLSTGGAPIVGGKALVGCGSRYRVTGAFPSDSGVRWRTVRVRVRH